VAIRLGAVVGPALPWAFLGAAMLAGLLLGPARARKQGPPPKGDATALSTKASAAGLGDRTLVRLGPEVRAVVAAPCPSDLVYPIDGARRVELAWGLRVADPADVRFKAVLRTADRRSHVILDETVKARTAEKPTWFSRVIDLPAGTEDGAVVLRTRGASSASFWAAPVFSRSSAVKPSRNVILVSLDTVRADHLNAYGYTRRRTSPEFDGWAGKGTLFEAAMSPAPGTLSSQMSILTGRYPSRHGVSYANWRLRGRMPVLRLDTPTLAEVLGPQGFRTAAFTGSGYFALPIGYSRGFGEFVSSNDEALGSAATVFEKAFGWLDRHRDDPFFLFLHTYEAHEPYLDHRFVEQEGPAIQGPKARNEALYDGDIRRADAYLGRLRRHLDRLGLASRTLVMILSDHGEEFGDHFPVWNDGHGHSLFEEQIHVPLMIVGPQVPAGRRVKQAVDLTAVAPTLLDFLGVKLPDGMDGRSLLGLIGGQPEAEGLAFSEDVWIGPATRAVRTRAWKLIEKGEVLPERFVDTENRRLISKGVDALAPRMLFELAVDPREQENQLGSGGPVAARLGHLLGERLARGSPAGPDAEIEVEGEVLDRLRALGYVQ
jgi:arylsulfatase A-like enzyme